MNIRFQNQSMLFVSVFCPGLAWIVNDYIKDSCYPKEVDHFFAQVVRDALEERKKQGSVRNFWFVMTN